MDWEKLLPPYQDVRLPSLGKFYDKEPLNSGWIKIRGYAAPEESLIASINVDNIQKSVDSILRNCIEGDNIEIGELTSEDGFYLLVWLRANSYSPDYTIEVSCPHCKSVFPYVINLSKLNIKYLEEDVKEPLEVTLPKTNLKVFLNVMRRSTEDKAQERLPEIKKYDPSIVGNPIGLLRRAYSISKVIDGEEVVTDRLAIEELCLKYLPSEDSLYLDDQMEIFRHGVDTKISFPCTNCNKEIATILPPSNEFFRPSKFITSGRESDN